MRDLLRRETLFKYKEQREVRSWLILFLILFSKKFVSFVYLFFYVSFFHVFYLRWLDLGFG